MSANNVHQWLKLAFRLLINNDWDAIADRVENGDPFYRWLREVLILKLRSIQRDAWETLLAHEAFLLQEVLQSGDLRDEETYIGSQWLVRSVEGLFIFDPKNACRFTPSQRVLGGKLELLQNFMKDLYSPNEAGKLVCRIFDKITDIKEVCTAIYENDDPKLAYDVKEMYDLTKEYAEKMKIPLEDLVELEFDPECLPKEPPQPYKPPETWVFGMFGSEDGKLAGPYQVQVDKEGNYLVLDRDNNENHMRLQLFDPLGKLIKVILKRAEGKVHDMIDFCLDKSGNIVVADHNEERRARIQVFDYDANQLMLINVDHENPANKSFLLTVFLDEDENIIVTDNGCNCVRVYGKDGKLKSRFGKFGHGDNEFMDVRVAFAKDKKIYAFENTLDKTKVFDYDGNFIDSIWPNHGYGGILFHTDGHIYTFNRDTLHKIDLEGKYEAVAKGIRDGLDDFSSITGISSHPDGRMVLSDGTRNRIIVFRV